MQVISDRNPSAVSPHQIPESLPDAFYVDGERIEVVLLERETLVSPETRERYPGTSDALLVINDDTGQRRLFIGAGVKPADRLAVLKRCAARLHAGEPHLQPFPRGPITSEVS